MNQEYKISAVIPAYNCEKYIARAIDSVLNQTRPVDEIVVVDDGSTDQTARIIKGYGDKVRYIYQPNAGVSAARNTGIKAAACDWITFLDADDEWLPDKIRLQVETLENHPDLVWTTGNYYECLCDENRRAEQYPQEKIGKLLGDRKYFDSYFKACEFFLWGSSDVQMIRRDVLIEAGLFPIDQKIAEDIDTWLRVAYIYPKVGFVAIPLAIYHFDNPRSGQQMHKGQKFHRAFIAKHFKLAQVAGKIIDFQPVATSLMKCWIRGMLFQGRKSEIRELLNRFPQCFSIPYRSLIYTATIFPHMTASILHLLSKIIRAFKLRRRVTRRPPQPA